MIQRTFQADPRILQPFNNRAGRYKPHFLKLLLENPTHLEGTGDMKFHQGTFSGQTVLVITKFEPSNPVKLLKSGLLWIKSAQKTQGPLEPYVKIYLEEVAGNGLQLEVQDTQGDFFSQDFIGKFIDALVEALQKTEMK